MDAKRTTVRDMRRANRAVLLTKLYRDGPLSRHDLVQSTALSQASVSNLAGELIDEGLVEEAGQVESDGGRPRVLLRVAPEFGYIIGVDVGETRVQVELFDMSMTARAKANYGLDSPAPAPDDVVSRVLDGLRTVVAQAGVEPSQVLGVGVAVSGVVDVLSGRDAVVHAQTLGWDAVPLGAMIRAGTDLPVLIDNGAKTLGQAEMWFGGGRGARNAVVVLFGSGVGACLVTPEVEHGRAVEWGHLTVRVRGRRCRCGALGCLEAYAGAESLLERWREEGGQPPEGVDEETALTAMLAAAYPAAGAEADPVALAVLEETAEYLGAGLSDLINLFQPERILIGGWAGLQLGARFLPAVRRHAASYALRHPAEKVTVELGRLGPDAVTVGAAILPLADFFARGGRRPEPAPEGPAPAWRTALQERAPH
jgi:predicted NBD/HSP70 family sugar kinase